MGSREAFFGYASVALAGNFTSLQALYVHIVHHEMFDGVTLVVRDRYTATRFSKNPPSFGLLKGPGRLL